MVVTYDDVNATAALDTALALARDGDDDGFRVVYRLIQPGLLRYVRALVRDEADDVTSEAWLQIAGGIRDFQGDGSAFRAWAATIARNRAFDHLRRLRRRPALVVPDEALTDISDEFDTETIAMSRISTENALSLLKALAPDQAEAVLLRVVMGLDAKAAGRVLGKRAGAVRTAMYRGLRRLAALLEESEESRVPTRHSKEQV